MSSSAKNTSQRDYLKQYLKKTKRKKTKSVSSRRGNVKLIDDDIEVYQSKREEFFIEDDEDAPVIAAVIDERPTEVRLAERYSNTSRWKRIDGDDDECGSNDRGSRHRRTPDHVSPARQKRTRSDTRSEQRVDSGTSERSDKRRRKDTSAAVRDRDKRRRENVVASANGDVHNDRRRDKRHPNDLTAVTGRESRERENQFANMQQSPPPCANRSSHLDRRDGYGDDYETVSLSRDSRSIKRDKQFREPAAVQEVDKHYREELRSGYQPHFEKHYGERVSTQRNHRHSDREGGGRHYRDELTTNALFDEVVVAARSKRFRDDDDDERQSLSRQPFAVERDKRRDERVSPSRSERPDRRNRRHADHADARNSPSFRGGEEEDVSVEHNSYSQKRIKRKQNQSPPGKGRHRDSPPPPPLSPSPREHLRTGKWRDSESNNKLAVNKNRKHRRSSRSEEKMAGEEYSRERASAACREERITGDGKRDSRATTKADHTKKARYEEEDRRRTRYESRDRGSRSKYVEEVDGRRRRTPAVEEVRESWYVDTDDLDKRLSDRGAGNRYPNNDDNDNGGGGYDDKRSRLSPRRERGRRDRYADCENLERLRRFDDELDAKRPSRRQRERYEENFDERGSSHQRFATEGRGDFDRRFSPVPRSSRDRFARDFDRKVSPGGRGGHQRVFDDQIFAKTHSPRREGARHRSVENDNDDVYDRRRMTTTTTMAARFSRDRDDEVYEKKRTTTKKDRHRVGVDVSLERNSSSSKKIVDKFDDDRSSPANRDRNKLSQQRRDQRKRRSPTSANSRQRFVDEDANDNGDDDDDDHIDAEKRASLKRTRRQEISCRESSKAEKNSRDAKSDKYGLLDAKKNRSKSEEKISDELSGKNANTIYRDRKTGKKRDFEAEKLEKIEKRRREEEKKAQYYEWGHGMKQVQEEKEKIRSDLHEMSKPLARYADDEDLDRHLRDKEMVGDDPMLAFIHEKRRKKEEKEGKVTKPRYKGSYLPNRFGIPPGHRWDGVDRSNGFENKWFAKQNDRKAREEEAYKWCSADM